MIIINSINKKLKGLQYRLNMIFEKKIASNWLLRLYFTNEQRNTFIESGDPVRYSTIFLATKQLAKEKIDGSIAECGVFKGRLSKFLHALLPDRQLFLFDTFTGFDPRDTDNLELLDSRFNDTSIDNVIKFIGDTNNIMIRKGFFPKTAEGLENERFAMVIIDFDKYEPTLAALEFFYPRINTGGFIFVHDYSSPESNWACSRALDKFLLDKTENVVLIPDSWGTALFRKV